MLYQPEARTRRGSHLVALFAPAIRAVGTIGAFVAGMFRTGAHERALDRMNASQLEDLGLYRGEDRRYHFFR